MKTIKIPRFFKKKKFLAATARRASAASAGTDFDGIPEPNMKLSRALLVVLLLHVVAVSGIVAFNAIKTRESSFVPANPTHAENTPANTAGIANQAGTDTARVATVQKENTQRTDVKPSHSPSKQEHTTSPVSSGKTYLIKKGDNPVIIAKKLKVPYDDLMSLNHIEDPHKLQIGQKLLIPERTNSKTASAKASNHKKKSK
jgi:LysM repeat protein